MSTKPTSLLAKIAGLVSGAAALTVIAIVANAAGRESFARGAVVGGAITLLAIAVLWIRGARGGTAARLASGLADERERGLSREAGADAAGAMIVAGVAGAIWSLYDAPAIAVAGIVLWAGLLTFLVSLFIRSRRG